MQPFSKFAAKIVLAVLIATLAGCSEYLDRRDTIALSGGNAVYTDRVTHTVDPWPRDSANREIAFNGDKMQTAVERYRRGVVTHLRRQRGDIGMRHIRRVRHDQIERALQGRGDIAGDEPATGGEAVAFGIGARDL